MRAVWKAEIIKGSPAKSGRPKPWVARLTGLDDRYGFAREFVNGERDYSRGKEHHTRGVYLYFFLPPGLYEVFRPVSWRKNERYFMRVDERGECHKIKKERVMSILLGETKIRTSMFNEFDNPLDTRTYRDISKPEARGLARDMMVDDGGAAWYAQIEYPDGETEVVPFVEA